MPNPKSTILVVEDDHSTQVALREALEGGGYTVVTVTNGLDAIRHLKTHQPHPSLILLDWGMPLMNGAEFLGARAAFGEELKKIPVALMSGSQIPEPFVKEVSGLLKKPVSLDDLIRSVERFLVFDVPPAR